MAAHQAPPSLGFSRQEYQNGLPFPSPMHESEKWKWSRSVVSDSSLPHGLQPTRLLHPWDFPGRSTGVGCHWHSLKNRIFFLNNSGSWEAQDQGSITFSVWWGPSSWFFDGYLFAVSSLSGRGQRALLKHFYKVTDPIHEGSMTQLALKKPHNFVIMVVRISLHELGGGANI